VSTFSRVLSPVAEGVASLRISSDSEPYLGRWTVSLLATAVREVCSDSGIRAVLVEGGERYFSAGANRGDLLAPDARMGIVRDAVETTRLLLDIPVPTVAAMAGHGIGGGFVLGLWCDAVVLAEESLYGANFMALGFTPGMGSTALLDEALGGPLAREMLFTGRIVKGREFVTSGTILAHAVVPRRAVKHRALSIASEMAEAPREALELLKQTLASRRRAVLNAALDQESTMQRAVFERQETRLQISERYGFITDPTGPENAKVEPEEGGR
jgi:polyketide biosynthesis enoyl-CoA hydratase PksI